VPEPDELGTVVVVVVAVRVPGGVALLPGAIPVFDVAALEVPRVELAATEPVPRDFEPAGAVAVPLPRATVVPSPDEAGISPVTWLERDGRLLLAGELPAARRDAPRVAEKAVPAPSAVAAGPAAGAAGEASERDGGDGVGWWGRIATRGGPSAPSSGAQALGTIPSPPRTSSRSHTTSAAVANRPAIARIRRRLPVGSSRTDSPGAEAAATAPLRSVSASAAFEIGSGSCVALIVVPADARRSMAYPKL